MNKLEKYDKLQQRKTEIENEINELSKILVEEGNVGMSGNLLDSEGFPRSDIDIYKIRLTRQRINCLQNDYKDLMSEIEEEIIRLHAASRSKSETNRPVEENHTEQRPFIKITQVDEKSPSWEAGLKCDDQIIQFGPYNYNNSKKNLSEVADLVKNSINKIILLNVLRKTQSENLSSNDENLTKYEQVKIKLIPKQWSGHGVLGCKLVPID